MNGSLNGETKIRKKNNATSKGASLIVIGSLKSYKESCSCLVFSIVTMFSNRSFALFIEFKRDNTCHRCMDYSGSIVVP